jgi:multiple antibiotic resistance protein
MDHLLIEYLTSTFVTLLVIVDPPGLAPIFLGLTAGMTREARRSVANRASIIAALVLAFFGLAGAPLLQFLGITLPAFRIAGGLLLFWIAFEMLFERRNERKNSTARTAIDADHIKNVAAFPLAIPLMAGPGAITASILTAGSANGDPLRIGGFLAIIAIIMLMSWLVFRVAERISGMLGVTGNVVLTRLLGLLLAALACQFVIDGVRAAFAIK